MGDPRPSPMKAQVDDGKGDKVDCMYIAHDHFKKYKALRRRSEMAHATLAAMGFAVDLDSSVRDKMFDTIREGMGFMACIIAGFRKLKTGETRDGLCQQVAGLMKSDNLTCPAQLMAYMIAHGAAA